MNVILRKLRAAKNILKRNYAWHRDTYCCRKRIHSRELLTISDKNILILAPHSDDEWIGCSQLLKKGNNNVVVLNFDMPGGDNKELHTVRYQEMKNTAATVGYTFITVRQDKGNWLLEYINSNRIDIVFLPCYYDWHKEHFFVMECFKEAARKAHYTGLVGMYQVSLPIPVSMINYCSLMSKADARKKWADLKRFYPSQSFLPIKRFMLNEHINGKINNAYSIEAYSVKSFEIWQREYHDKRLTENDKEFFKKNLQNISLVRQHLKSKYEEVQ